MNDRVMNERLLLILGFGASLISEFKRFAPKDREKDILWFIQALDNVVYQDKPLPPFPEKEITKFTKEKLKIIK